MQIKNILILLIALIVLINYNNYILPNRDKLHTTLELLKQKISKEEHIISEKIDPKNLFNPYKDVFFSGKQYTYSNAMGELQKMINESADGLCTINQIHWAQIPVSSNWYDRLKMQLRLECHPDNLVKFINNLYKNKKLIYTEHFRLMKQRKKNTLSLLMDVIAYRSKNDAQ